MHGDFSPRSPLPGDDDLPWYRGLTGYHWFVLAVAALGWMFDTMDQQLFNLARKPAMQQLLATPSGPASPSKVTEYGGYATAIFMIGWALGGIFFGILGDRLGRARTMLLTILAYSLFTGLSALSVGFYDFALYRFLTGLGVGGEFAVGVALVAEVMPDRSRPFALGLLQAASGIGNMTAALVAMGLGHLEEAGSIGSAWRLMFVIGTVPALMALVIRRRLKEPERWKSAARVDASTPDQASSQKLGSLSELFGNPRWRHNAIVGMILGFSGVVGLWGIGFFSFDLIRPVFAEDLRAQNLPEAVIQGRLTKLTGLTSFFQNLGGFFGVLAFTWFTSVMGRRKAFAVSFLLAGCVTAYTFLHVAHYSQLFWLIPLMGFAQLTVFGGYAIYFPELFPTRLRSTGTSFCYNVGRIVAAVGPVALAGLTNFLRRNQYGDIASQRYAGVIMCSVFVIGLLVLPFAPETKGKPLPE